MAANKADFAGWGCVVAIALVGYGLYGAFTHDWMVFGDSLTDYQVYCDKEITNGHCTGTWYQVPNPTKYIVNKDQQWVIQKSDGWPPMRLTSCAVIDRKNWRCKAEDQKSWKSDL